MKMPDLMNDQKKAVIWAEWGNGSPMIQIARAIEKPPATVFSYLRYHGGITVLRHEYVLEQRSHYQLKSDREFTEAVHSLQILIYPSLARLSCSCR